MIIDVECTLCTNWYLCEPRNTIDTNGQQMAPWLCTNVLEWMYQTQSQMGITPTTCLYSAANERKVPDLAQISCLLLCTWKYLCFTHLRRHLVSTYFVISLLFILFLFNTVLKIGHKGDTLSYWDEKISRNKPIFKSAHFLCVAGLQSPLFVLVAGVCLARLALGEKLTGHNRGGSWVGTKLRGLKGPLWGIEGNLFFTLVNNFSGSEAQQPFIMVGSKPSTGEQRQQTLQCF